MPASLKNILNLTISLLILTSPLVMMGQTKAEKLLEQDRYADAAKVLARKVKQSPQDPTLNEQLAFVYRKLHRYAQSEAYYERADLLEGLSQDGLIHYGQVLLKNGKEERARSMFDRYLEVDPENFVARLMLTSIGEVAEWRSKPAAYNLYPIEGLNSRFSDFSPVPYKSALIFATERNVDHVNESSAGFNNMPYLAMFKASFDQEDKDLRTLKRAKPFLNNLNGDYHVGPIAIDSIQDRIYFTEVRTSLKNNTTDFLSVFEGKIHKGRKIKNKSQLIQGTDTFSVAHPTITRDGKTLVFASNMPGGYGGMDLYVIKKDSSGWSKPKLLPDKINTPLNEVFPFLKDDKTLFFSSDGHAGYGGLDIYETNLAESGSWTQPRNLRSPVNSRKDDFGITFMNESKGFVSSDRDGGVGKDDIYQFIRITDLENEERVEVSGQFVFNPLPSDGVTLNLVDEHENLLEVTQTDSNGFFIFKELPANESFAIRLEEKDANMLDMGQIFLLNEDGERVVVTQRDESKRFVFTVLPRDEVEDLADLDAENPDLGKYEIFGQLYSELEEARVGIELIAYDQSGMIVGRTTTDSTGSYHMTGLPIGDFVTIKANNRDSVVHRYTVFYADSSGTQELAVERNDKFTIEYSEFEEAPEEATISHLQGFVHYHGDPVDNIPVKIYNDSEALIEVSKTDKAGKFELRNVGSDEMYHAVLPDSLEGLDDPVDIYLVDMIQNEIINARAINWKVYEFKSLPSIESQLAAIEDEAMSKDFDVNGQIYQKLPGDYNGGIAINAYDESGNLIETAVTDEDGNFKFNKLRPDQVYSFSSDLEDPSELNVALFDEDGNIKSTAGLQEIDDFVFQKLRSDKKDRIALLVEEDFQMAIVPEYISGQVFKSLPGDYQPGTKVYAYDESGIIIDSAYTDAEGNFTFTRLSKNQDQFGIKVLDAVNYPLNIALYDINGTFLNQMTTDDENAFTYSKVMLQEAEELHELLEDDQDAKLTFGQVYKKLPGDFNNDLKVYALDDDGNLIDVAEVDEEGKFVFAKLSPEASYTLKMNVDDSDLNIGLLDSEGNVIDEAETDESGDWVFTKLNKEQMRLASIEAEDTRMAYTEPEEVVEEEKPEEKQVVAAEVKTFDEKEKEEIADVSTPAEKEDKATTTSDELLGASNLEALELHTFYFKYREYKLSATDEKMLNRMVVALNQNPDQSAVIESHIDASEKVSSRSYSTLRSTSISRYLKDKGIPLERMRVINMEELNPAVDCPEGTPCSDDQRKMNRYSEVRLVATSGLQAPPDFVLYYEFNQWKFSDQGNKEAYQLLKALAAMPPNVKIKLDGYTDTYGTRAVNDRISYLRAYNLHNLLVNKGVKSENITMVAHGESNPIGRCAYEYPCPIEDRQKNRRVEVRLSPRPGESK